MMGTKNNKTRTPIKIAVHILSQRKKLIHFFGVIQNIGKKLGRWIIEIKYLFNGHLKKECKLHRERKTWHIGLFFDRDNRLSRNSNRLCEHILCYFFSRSKLWKYVFYDLFMHIGMIQIFIKM